MNREECIMILEKSMSSDINYLKDNQYRYKIANQTNESKDDYDDIIKVHQEEIDRLKNAIKYLKENLK